MAGGLFSFGKSKSSSSSLDFGASQGSSFVSGAQAPFLDFLRNAGLDVFGGQQGGLQGLFGQSQGLFQQGQQALGGLTDNPFLDALQQQAGGNPELVQQQTEQLGSNLGRFFNEQLVPGINQQGVASGQFGQSRGNIGRGLAAQGVTRQFQQGATQLQAADAQRAQQAAGTGAQLFGQGSQAQLQGLQGLQGILSSPFATQLQPLLALAQVIGGPNVLSQQSAFNFGQQKSSSSGFNFGLGGGNG